MIVLPLHGTPGKRVIAQTWRQVRRGFRRHYLLLILLLFPALHGCATMLVDPLVEPLSISLQSQTDLELIREGTPSLLLLVDGLLADNPKDTKLLMAATQAYIFYAASIEEFGQTARAASLSKKAKDYGLALLEQTGRVVMQPQGSAEDFDRWLASVNKSSVASLFWGGFGWAAWVQYQNGAPAALADLPKLEQIMLRVVALDETYYHGAAHLFLGCYYGSRPAMLGGDPEKSRYHFERALEISHRTFLLTQVSYAEIYARMINDRELFKSLLQEVLASPPDQVKELAASNQIARLRARKLLDRIDDLF